MGCWWSDLLRLRGWCQQRANPIRGISQWQHGNRDVCLQHQYLGLPGWYLYSRAAASQVRLHRISLHGTGWQQLQRAARAVFMGDACNRTIHGGCKPNRRHRWWIRGTERHQGRARLLGDHRRLRQQCLGQLDRRPRAGGWIARQQHPLGSHALDGPLALGPARNPQLRNLLRRLLEQGSGAARLRPPAARLSPSLHGRR